MPGRTRKKAGQIGSFWLSQRRHSPMWCRTWFDPATRQTRRVSLGTDDFEEATLKLANWVLANGDLSDQHPQELSLEAVLARHYQQHARHLRSAEQYRYAALKWSDFSATPLLPMLPPTACVHSSTGCEKPVHRMGTSGARWLWERRHSIGRIIWGRSRRSPILISPWRPKASLGSAFCRSRNRRRFLRPSISRISLPI